VARPKRDDLAFLSDAAELWDTTDSELGYASRVFTQTSLPYRDPGDLAAWGRRNGRMALVVTPGMDIGPAGEPIHMGYPFGVVPRLVLTWLTTEAVKKKSPEIVLGESLADFMRQLGMASDGRSIRRLKDQMLRLFRSSIVVTYDDTERSAGARMGVAEQWNLWWSPKDNPGQQMLMPSMVRLSGEFFREATERPIPVSIDALRLLSGSPMRLDIYAWLTYRMSRVSRRSQIPWSSLLLQFGSQATTKQARHKFRSDFTNHLARVLAVYPDANVTVTPEGLILMPSRTHIAPRHLRVAAKSITSAAKP
jgi:hypothetical protein